MNHQPRAHPSWKCNSCKHALYTPIWMMGNRLSIFLVHSPTNLLPFSFTFCILSSFLLQINGPSKTQHDPIEGITRHYYPDFRYASPPFSLFFFFLLLLLLLLFLFELIEIRAPAVSTFYYNWFSFSRATSTTAIKW